MPLTDDLTEQNFGEKFDTFLDRYIQRELQKVLFLVSLGKES